MNDMCSSFDSQWVPAVRRGRAGSTDTSPEVSMVPVRKPIDERCPSLMQRTLMMKRVVPAGRLLWSKCSTADGLVMHAPSTEDS